MEATATVIGSSSNGRATRDESTMERLLLDYVRSYSGYFSRSESKLLQRAREQLFQELEMDLLVQRLERVHGPLKDARVLEVGSGSGSRAVAVALRGAEVVGIEPSEAGVKVSRLRAERYPGLRVRFQVGVGEQLPIPDGSFDLVFSTDVLPCVQSLGSVISENSRVLRTDGHCYHEAPNSLYPREFCYRIFWIPGMPKPLGKLYARMRGKDPRHLDSINFIYRRSLASLMRQHGFTQIGDLYPEELARKALQVDEIHSPAKRRAFQLARRLGIAAPVMLAVRAIGIHPQVRMYGTRAQ